MGFEAVQITTEDIAAADAKHGDVLVLRGDARRAPWVVVLRRPTRNESIIYKQHLRRDNATANEELVKRIAVLPSAADMAAQIERWPFLCDAVCDSKPFQAFLGLAVDEQEKDSPSVV